MFAAFSFLVLVYVSCVAAADALARVFEESSRNTAVLLLILCAVCVTTVFWMLLCGC